MSSSGRTHVRLAAALFAGLGWQLGLWAVLVPELVRSRGLTPAQLGAALGALAAASIVSLAVAGPLADRVGRRPLACAGAAGLGAMLVLLAAVEARAALLPIVVGYGLANGCLDIAANVTGADGERVRGEKLMIRLHAGFSGAAALAALAASAALAAGAGHRAVYAAGGVALLALAAVVAVAPFPWHAPAPPRAPMRSPERGPRRRAHAARSLATAPGGLAALAVVTLCFLGDGALGGYAALYLRDLPGGGALASGAGLAAFHAASLAGRLLAARLQRRLGDAHLVSGAGAGAAAGMLLVLLGGSAPLAAAGLLVVGLCLAPVVPTALSVAGRAVPGRAGAAVALVTTVGYGAFVAAPPLTGALAEATTLRVALAPVVGTTLLLAVAARRLA